MSLFYWRRPIETVYRTVGRGVKVVNVPHDFHEWPLSYDNFTTGQSEYEIASDEAYCPCGAVLPWPEGDLGSLLRVVLTHCGSAGHPVPRFDR